MPNFNPKNIISKVIWRSRQPKEEDSSHHPSYKFLSDISEPLLGKVENDDNDENSILTFSAFSTMANDPGTRDIYLYQPMGRKIQRMAMRFSISISSPHPARIQQFIESYYTDFEPTFFDSWTINDAIAVLSKRQDGSMIVAGLKGLVKQTQSKSMYRSASALAALIRISLTIERKEFYVNVSRIKPIFDLERRARLLSPSHPEKKYFLLLSKIARETLLAVTSPSDQEGFNPFLSETVEVIWPSTEHAIHSRQRLMEVMKLYKSSGFDSLDVVLGDACAICAEFTSTCIYYCARGEAYMHILETVYFTVIFILRSIIELHESSNTSPITMGTVLNTLTYWIDAIVYRCLFFFGFRHQRFDMGLLKARLAFRSLVIGLQSIVNTSTKLPQSFTYAEQTSVMDKCILPRRIRVATKWTEDDPVVRSLTESFAHRTRRLLRSYSELEREVVGSSSEIHSSAFQSKTDADPLWLYLEDFGEEWRKNWEDTRKKALRVQVPEDNSTREFRGARLESYSWAYYDLHRCSRHKWGQYVRSNLDWDWDLGTCMNRLFKVEKPTRVEPSPAAQSIPVASPEIDVRAHQGEAWKISTGEEQGGVPKHGQTTSEAETSGTKYRSSIPAAPRPRHHATLVEVRDIADAGFSSSDDDEFVDCED